MALDLFTQRLSTESFFEEMRFACDELSRWPDHDFMVRLGFGCRNRETLRVRPAELPKAVAERIPDHSFVPGSADLFVESTDGTVRLELSFAADIHLSTEDPSLASAFRARWHRLGYRFHEIAALRFEGREDPEAGGQCA